MTLEEKLALYRKFEHEYSTYVLCEALHITRGTYYKRIVLGDTPIDYQNAVKKLCHGFNLSSKKVIDDLDLSTCYDYIQKYIQRRGSTQRTKIS